MKPKKHELWILFLISFFLIAVGRIAVAADFSTELIKIESRKGVTQKFILIKPENPELSVIMMPGSNGCLKLSGLFGNISIGSLKRDFLVRNRENIAKQNIMVAVMDASSDKQSKKIECFWMLKFAYQWQRVIPNVRRSRPRHYGGCLLLEENSKCSNLACWFKYGYYFRN